MADLPSGWRIARFDEFLKKVDRRFIISDSETYKCVGVRWYGMGAFVREELPGMDISRKQQWIIKTGDVVYNKLFAWKNSFAIADESVDGCIVSDKFPTYAADLSLVDLKFLGYYFRMPKIGQQAQDLSKGAAAISKLTLNPPQFWDLTIPLPPLEEQRRLVARIEALAVKIEEARGLRRLAVEETSKLLSSARRGLIGEEPTDKWVRLKTYVKEIENGRSPDCEKRPATDDEWGVLKVGAISFGVFDPDENKALPLSIEPRPEYEVHVGDFLMSRANTFELVGACVLVEHTRPKLMLSDKNFRFIFREDAPIDRRYLNHVLKSPALRDQIVRSASGTSPTMKNISKEKVLDLLVPQHGLEEQRRIVAYLDGLQARVDALKALQAQTQAELDALLPSVLDKAFKGEL